MIVPVVEYLFAEAASGQVPTVALDRQPNPLNMAITYSGADPSYVAPHTGRGVLFASIDSAAGFDAGDISATKLGVALNGAKTVTYELVVDIQSNTSVMGITNSAGADAVCLGVESGTTLDVFGNGCILKFSGAVPSGRKVFHVVYDSTQATASNRVKLYRNGVLVAPDGGAAYPGLNNGFIASAGYHLFYGQSVPGSGDGPAMKGSLYYAAVYSVAFSATDAASRSAELLIWDDAPVDQMFFGSGSTQ